MHARTYVGIVIACKTLVGMAYEAAADSAVGDTGPYCLEHGNGAEKRLVVTILAIGII